jgi:peroxiredoxin
LRKSLGYVFFCICFLIAIKGLSFGSPILKGAKLPSIRLLIPADPVERNYLRLSGKGYFNIPDIKANAVIIHVFSSYCPTCHTTAMEMIELFYKVETHPEFKEKMKFIGIGAGNTAGEVQAFKETYNIPFPLFSDKDFEIHSAFGNVRTPHLFAVKIEKGGKTQVVYTQSGGWREVDEFLELMIKVCGLNVDDSRGWGKSAAISVAEDLKAK